MAARKEGGRLDAVAQAATGVRDRFSSRTHAAARYVAQRIVLKPTIWSITSVTVLGREQLRDVRGGFVVVANHSSHLDAPLVVGALPRRLARYLATGAAADYFFEVRWRRALTELFFNAFPVQRSSATRVGSSSVVSGPADATGASGPAAAADAVVEGTSSVARGGAAGGAVGGASAGGASAGGAVGGASARGSGARRTPARQRAAAKSAARQRRGQPTVTARSLLERGYPVLVFPEGTRSKNGEVGPFKPGAAALASAVGVPVIPLALIGAHIAHPRGSHWPRPGRLPVGVAFGAPMRPREGETPTDFSERLRAEVLRLRDANTTRVLGRRDDHEGAPR